MAAAAIKAPSPAVPPPGAPGGDAGAGAANAAEALRQRYRRACEERRVQPIAPLQRLLDGLLPTKHNAVNIHSLLLRGSQPELFDARVSYNQLDAMTETLKGVCPMHTLDLSYNFIDDTGAKLVAEFLRETSVKVVNVSGNDIGAAGMLSIAEAAGLTMRGGMQELLVGGNLFGLEGAKALASLIGSSRSLLVLNMKGCGIGLDGLIHITAALSAGAAGQQMRCEAMTHRMWCRCLGQTQEPAQLLHLTLDRPCAERPASRTADQGFVGCQRVRAGGNIGFDCLAHDRQNRHHALLAALTEDADRIAGWGLRMGQTERFGNPQTAAIE